MKNAKCAFRHKISVENECHGARKRAVRYAIYRPYGTIYSRGISFFYQYYIPNGIIAAKSRRDDPLLTVGFNLRSGTLRTSVRPLRPQLCAFALKEKEIILTRGQKTTTLTNF